MTTALQAEREPRFFEASDGTRLAYYEMGEGPAVVLVHGLFSNAWTNWVRYGHAAKIAAAGYRVIMPDLRGHGESAKPYDAASWPPDVMAADGEDLIAHLGLIDFILGGYSLGARTTVRMLARGTRAGAAVICGIGLDGLLHTSGRGGFFRKVLEGYGTHPRGSAEWMAEAFLKTTGGDPRSMLPLLGTFVDTPLAEIEALDLPAIVISGREDQDNGSAAELAKALPHGSLAEIPGNHMSAVMRPELGDEILQFLTGI